MMIFSEAAIVLSDFGEPGKAAIAIAQNRTDAKPQDYFSVNDLEEVLISFQN